MAKKLKVQWEKDSPWEKLATELDSPRGKKGGKKKKRKSKTLFTVADGISTSHDPELGVKIGKALRGPRIRNAGLFSSKVDKNRDLVAMLTDTNVESLEVWYNNFYELAYSRLKLFMENYDTVAWDVLETLASDPERAELVRLRNSYGQRAVDLDRVITAVRELRPKVEYFNQIAMREAYELPHASPAEASQSMKFAQWLADRPFVKLADRWGTTIVDIFNQAREGYTNNLKTISFMATAGQIGPGAPEDKKMNWIFNLDVNTPLPPEAEEKDIVVMAPEGTVSGNGYDAPPPADLKWDDSDAETASTQCDFSDVGSSMHSASWQDDEAGAPVLKAGVRYEGRGSRKNDRGKAGVEYGDEASYGSGEDFADWKDDGERPEHFRYGAGDDDYDTDYADQSDGWVEKASQATRWEDEWVDDGQEPTRLEGVIMGGQPTGWNEPMYNAHVPQTSIKIGAAPSGRYSSAGEDVTPAEKLKRELDLYMDNTIEPMRAAILRHGVSLEDYLSKDANGNSRDISEIRMDIQGIDIEALGAVFKYNEQQKALADLYNTYRSAIHQEAYIAMLDKPTGDKKLVRKWGNKVDKLTEGHRALANKYHSKLNKHAEKLRNKPNPEKKIRKLRGYQAELVRLRKKAKTDFGAWKDRFEKEESDVIRLDKYDTPYQLFEKMFISTGTLEQKCRDINKSYGLTFSSRQKAFAWSGVALTILAFATGVYLELRSDDDDTPDNPEPTPREGAKQDLYILYQGDTRIINLTGPDGLFQDDGALEFLIDKTFGNVSQLNLEIDESGEYPAVLINASNPAKAHVGKYTFRVHATEKDQKGKAQTIHEDIATQIKDNPTVFEGYIESLGVDPITGTKLFKLNTAKLVDAQGQPVIDVKIGDSEWINIDNLSADQVIEMNRAFRPGLAQTQVRATDPFGNEKTFEGEVEVPNYPTIVTGGYIDEDSLDYNLTIEAGTLTAEQFNVADWDGPAQGDLVMRLTDSEGEVKQSIEPLKKGEMSVNLTWMDGELAGGNCSLKVTQERGPDGTAKELINTTSYVWQSAPSVELDVKDGEHDYLYNGTKANHSLKATVTNDAGQETTLALAVNGYFAKDVIFNQSEMSNGTHTKNITIENRFTHGINTIEGTPSDYDVDNNINIDAKTVVKSTIFSNKNHGPQVVGNLSQIMQTSTPLTDRISRGGSLTDLFTDVDGDELITLNDTDIIFTGGRHKYDEDTGRLELYPEAKPGMYSLSITTRDPDGVEAVASIPIEIVAQPEAKVLDCYSDSNGTLYLNGKADFGANCESLEVILRSGGVEKAKFSVTLKEDGTFNATTPSGLESDVYEAEMIGHDANGAPISNELTDKVVVMPTPERIIGNQYDQLNTAIKNAIEVDFRSDIVAGQNSWQTVYGIVGNVISLHSSDPGTSEATLELTEALHYAYENIIPAKINDLTNKLIYPVVMVAPNNAQGGALSVRSSEGDFVLDAELGVITYADVYSWDFQFATDEDCDRLTPQELATAIQYSIGNVDKRDFEGDFGTYDASVSFTERCRQSLVNKQLDDVLKQVGAIKKLPDATRSSLLANTEAGTFIYDMA